MHIIVNKEIDLSTCTPDDLELCYPRGTQLSIELAEPNQLSVQGHNVLSDTFYALPIIEKTSYDVLTEIQKAGVYDINISSVDRVKIITPSETGIIHIRVIGG